MDATWGMVLMFASEEPCCTGCRLVPRGTEGGMFIYQLPSPRWPSVILGGVHFSPLPGLTGNPSVPEGKPHGRQVTSAHSWRENVGQEDVDWGTIQERNMKKKM